MKCGVNQPCPVVVRNDLNAFRQNGLVELFDFCLHRLEHFRRIFTFAHEHDAVDDVVLAILAHQPFARHVVDFHFGHVAHQHGHAVVRVEDDVPDVVGRMEQAEAANKILLRALFDLAAAHVGVATAKRGVERLQVQAVVTQAGEVGIDLVRLDRATHAHDVRHARHHAQVAFDHPIFERAQVARVLAIAFEPVTVNLANGRGERRDLRLHSLRQIGGGQSLHYLLPHKIVGHLVVEGNHDERQAELRVRKQPHRMR